MLEIQNLQFSYDYYDVNFLDKPLLHNISFKLNCGSIMHIKGKNGSGKTTLLKLIAGIFTPIAGDIKYKGSSVLKNTYNYKNILAYVGHKLGLNLQLTVMENCYYALKNTKSKPEIQHLLRVFNLELLQDKLLALLSAGQRKRLSLLVLLLSKSDIWILDEPFTALDVDFIDNFIGIIRNHLRQGGVVIYTSHQAVAINDVHQIEYNL